ncbi:uncharacterized protein LOC114861926 isoform X6 [Betta splendens]|uniref:Uncharacterized protein LOC114861926 isoform X6 n=1 Tax=Betta splendens TaxID=158456 RepID=A0A9W2Y0R5_BETSP|nr:uncharacterized protein LOC114861926 isoform X6 [Betta splendens]
MDLLCWGNGELGQTGCGGTQDISPEEAHLEKFTMAKLGKVKVLACGSSHSIVVTVDNRIFAWGDGTSGQLGCGERTIKDRPTEVRLAKELNVTGEDVPAVGASIVGVACGSRHSFLWTETGQAYSFGNNFYAQLGYDFQRADFKEHQLAPRLFRSLPSSLKTSQVACGERHTLFALEDGRVAACGHNDCGQIGCGSTENAPVPRFVELAGPVSKVTCGANHNLALTGDGRLHQWGCGRACGNVERNLFLPEEVTAPSSPLRDVAGGRWHSLLLTASRSSTSGGVVAPSACPLSLSLSGGPVLSAALSQDRGWCVGGSCPIAERLNKVLRLSGWWGCLLLGDWARGTARTRRGWDSRLGSSAPQLLSAGDAAAGRGQLQCGCHRQKREEHRVL